MRASPGRSVQRWSCDDEGAAGAIHVGCELGRVLVAAFSSNASQHSFCAGSAGLAERYGDARSDVPSTEVAASRLGSVVEEVRVSCSRVTVLTSCVLAPQSAPVLSLHSSRSVLAPFQPAAALHAHCRPFVIHRMLRIRRFRVCLVDVSAAECHQRASVPPRLVSGGHHRRLLLQDSQCDRGG